jgi:hypothetical protein
VSSPFGEILSGTAAQLIPRARCCAGAAKKEATTSASAVPDGTEVLLVVGPQAKQLKALESLSREVGMGCVIILVNARLDEIVYDNKEQEVPPFPGSRLSLAECAAELQAFMQAFFREEYQRVFYIKTAPLPSWSGGVLYRSYPDEWILGVPRKIGPPKVLISSAERPSMEEMDAAMRKEQEEISDTPELLKGLPNPFDMFK